MKSLVKQQPTRGIWMLDTDKPVMGHNDLLIKIRKTAICGTDMHIYQWDDWAQKTIPVPMVVGHEYVGEVVDMGQEVQGFKVGDRVSGEGHITCGHCRNCRAGRRHLCRNTEGVGVNRAGAFAEYLVIPAFNAFKIPDNISDDLASIFDPVEDDQGLHGDALLGADIMKRCVEGPLCVVDREEKRDLRPLSHRRAES